MRAYLATTSTVFALLTLAHLWRVTVETHLARDPWYFLVTVAAAMLGAWGGWLLFRFRRS